jgi:hypothetical protein
MVLLALIHSCHARPTLNRQDHDYTGNDEPNTEDEKTPSSLCPTRVVRRSGVCVAKKKAERTHLSASRPTGCCFPLPQYGPTRLGVNPLRKPRRG